MDSQKNNESRDRRREEALARRMGDALDQLANKHAHECPEPELIAAYHENSLEPDEIARWEGHFAICGRCRKILAVLGAAVEAPLAEKEVARLGELIAATRTQGTAVARPTEPARPNRVAWRTRWLAPALGIAAVLAVWFAMRPPWRTVDQNTAGTLIAQGPKSEPPPSTEARAVERSSEETSKKNSRADAESLKDRPIARLQLPNSPADALAKNRLDGGRVGGALAPSAGVAESTLRDEKKEKAESYRAPFGETGNALPSPSAQLAPRPPQSAQALPRDAQLQAAQEAAQVATPSPSAAQSDDATESAPANSKAESASGRAVSNAPAHDQALDAPAATGNKTVARPSADMPVNGRDFRALSVMKATGENAALLKSPSGSILWRVGNGGNIQRSSDAGRTWILQTSPLQEDWLAGAAVSNTVCWIVGRNGAIAHTTDGGHWEKIAPPPLAADSSGKLPDWISIAATGVQTATITSTDQRRYVTQDGGKTWRAQ